MKGIFKVVFCVFLIGLLVVVDAKKHKHGDHEHDHDYEDEHHSHDHHHDHNPHNPHGDIQMVAKTGEKTGCPVHKDGQVKDCPAFKEGCPYSEEHGKPSEEHKQKIESEIANCPEFKEGCPYGPKHTASGPVKDCPAFKEGCPYADVHTEPTEEQKEKIEAELSNCPKFKEGCPYGPKHETMRQHALSFLQCLVGIDRNPVDSLVSSNFEFVTIHSDIEKFRNKPLSVKEIPELITAYSTLFTNDKEVGVLSSFADGHHMVMTGGFEGTYNPQHEATKGRTNANYPFAAV